MTKMLHLRHHDGREIAVAPADFKKGAEDEYKGFRVLGFEDGSSYDGPRTATEVVREKDAKPAPKSGKTPYQDAIDAGMVHKDSE